MKLYQSLGELTDLVKRINHHWKFKHPFGAEMDVHLDPKWTSIWRVSGGLVVLIRKTLSKMNNYYILGKHVSPGQHGAGGGQSNAACHSK